MTNQEQKVEEKKKIIEKKPAKEMKEKILIYIGPTIKNVVTANTIFNNGLPKLLKEEIKKQPLLNNLIIPVENLAKAKVELGIWGSGFDILYKKVNTYKEDGK